MDADTWQQIGGIGALLLIGGFNAWQARRANKQTQTTGNGFADEVQASLQRIEGKTDQTHTLMVQHLSDHAGHDLDSQQLSVIRRR